MRTTMFITIVLCALLMDSCGSNTTGATTGATTDTSAAAMAHKGNPYYSRTDTTHLNVSNENWKKILPGDVYDVSRLKETEHAFSGKYYKTDTKGTYYCVACGNPLFRSTDKFASTCGWPSFFESIRPNSVKYTPDDTHSMQRTEVTCGRCDGHLGHLFDDGPPPTYKRFCMNSLVLEFEPDVK